MHLTRTPKACDLMEVAPSTLRRLVRDGTIRPALTGGTGREHAFAPVQVLGAGLYQTVMKSTGVARIARIAASWAQRQEWESLGRSIDAGRTHLLIVGGRPASRLLTKDEWPEHAQRMLRDESGPRVCVASDISRAYRLLVEHIRDQQPQEAAANAS